MVSAAAAREFLSQRRIAVVGVSRDPRQLANLLFRALREQGCEAIPVNPRAAELEGAPAYPSVQQIPGPVDGAIVMLPPAARRAAVLDLIGAGVPRIWFQSPTGPGVDADLAALAAESGARVLNGGCPFMFLEGAGWFHRLHGVIARWTHEVQG
ncbi:MAG: CoA-binding protein [Bacillota bacterium]